MKFTSNTGISRRAALKMGVGAITVPVALRARHAWAQGERTLTVGVPGPTSGGSINPTRIGTGIPDQYFVQPAYDPLIWRQPDGSYAPGLALEWGPNDPENKSFFLKLRPGVTFSTGEPFNAAAVKNYLEYFRDGTGIFAGRFKTIEAIDTPDDLTVVMTLSESDAAWPFSFCQDRYGYMVSPQGTQNEEALAKDTFGTGPYVLDVDNTVSQSRYEYVKRDGYWNPDAQYWDRIVVTVIADPAARLAAVLAGQVDIVIGDATTADTAEAQGALIAHAPYLWNTLTVLDRGGEDDKAIGDPRVRTALQYAVDREVLCEAIFGKYATPNAILITPEFDGFLPDLADAFPYDPDKARALLAEAGYADGLEIDVLIFNRQGLEGLWTQALSGYYADVGVTLNLHEPEPSTVLTHLSEHTWSTFSFFGQVEEPNLLVQEQMLPASGILNPYRHEDPVLLDAYRRFHAAPPEEQPAIQKEMQRRIVEQAYYPCYGISDVIYFHNDKVTGLDVTAAEPILNLMAVAPSM